MCVVLKLYSRTVRTYFGTLVNQWLGKRSSREPETGFGSVDQLRKLAASNPFLERTYQPKIHYND